MSDAWAESDDESTSRGPFAYPYAYGFAASSWELRKNLTETFNQHVVEKEEKEASTRSESSSSVTNKIAQYEHKSTRSGKANSAAVRGKPPRQPLSAHPSNASGATASQEKRCVSVYLRIRPPKVGTTNTIEIVPNELPTKVRTHAPAKSNAAKISRLRNSSSFQMDPPTVVREFDFKEVFGPDQQNQDVHSKVVAPMVDRMFPSQTHRGTGRVDAPESGLLFAYGATNAGKTYSILGKPTTKNRDGTAVDQKHLGIVPRAIADIINKISAAEKPFELYLSYYEIYNEQIYDLLEEDKTSRNPIVTREPLKLRESRNKNTIIRGLQKRRIKDAEEGLKLARRANSKRQTSSNNLNRDSSRSHCICQLQVVQRDTGGPKMAEGSAASNGYNTEEEATQISKQTSLWIVDLAGSERNKRTNVGSLRQKEASIINKSLMNLMRCLSIIRENQSTERSSQVIPFRENKLTHLFMPIFTGRRNSSISMIVNVNPAAPDFDETNHVLSYASQARLVQIENKKVPANQTQSIGEYGFNGRLVKSAKPSATAKFAKLVKKLSPKKLIKRANGSKDEKKKANESNVMRKRKATPPAIPNRVPSFSSTASNVSQNLQKTKKMRVAAKPSRADSNSRPAKTLSASEGDMKSLKMALSIAQAEIEVLKSDKAKLTDELSQVEAKIRLEVSEEMTQQLERTTVHYTSIINNMKAQARESLGVFEKKAREEKATEEMELLHFKFEEAEEEMKRQAEAHEGEIFCLQQQHEEQVSTLQKEIEQLKGQLAKPREGCGGNSDDIVEAQRQEIETLKKSKIDLIAAYEKLLEGEEEEEDEEEEEEEGSASEDEPEPSSPRYRTRFHKNRT